MRRSVGAATDQNLLVDTRAVGNLLSAPQGLNHFLNAARQAAAEVIVLDPLYSTHDQDENDTRSMAALCQSLMRLRDASKAALIVVHHVRKSIGREEIGSAFRGSSALHAVGDSYLLLTRPSAHLAATVELRFQFRYAAPPEPRLLQLDPQTLCFSAAGLAPSKAAASRKKVKPEHVTKALAGLGQQAHCPAGSRGPRLATDLQPRPVPQSYPVGIHSRFGGVLVFKAEYWDQLPSLSSEPNAKTPRRAFCAGAFLMDFLAGYPVLPIQRSFLSLVARPPRHACLHRQRGMRRTHRRTSRE